MRCFRGHVTFLIQGCFHFGSLLWNFVCHLLPRCRRCFWRWNIVRLSNRSDVSVMAERWFVQWRNLITMCYVLRMNVDISLAFHHWQWSHLRLLYTLIVAGRIQTVKIQTWLVVKYVDIHRHSLKRFRIFSLEIRTVAYFEVLPNRCNSLVWLLLLRLIKLKSFFFYFCLRTLNSK